MVSTPSGDRAIEMLEVGDTVWSIDPTSGERVTARIVSIRGAKRECIRLHMGEHQLLCTPDHPVFEPIDARFRPAGDWVTAGATKVLLALGDGVRATTVDRVESAAGVHEVYDLTLDVAPHTFVASRVLVHNKSPVGEWQRYEEVEGPTFTLDTNDDSRTFMLYPCLAGEYADEHDPRVEIFASFGALEDMAGTGQARAALIVWSEDSDGVPISDGPVPGADETVVPFGPSACEDGVTIEFRYLTPELGGSFPVEWTATVAVRVGYEDNATLEISPEP